MSLPLLTILMLLLLSSIHMMRSLLTTRRVTICFGGRRRRSMIRRCLFVVVTIQSFVFKIFLLLTQHASSVMSNDPSRCPVCRGGAGLGWVGYRDGVQVRLDPPPTHSVTCCQRDSEKRRIFVSRTTTTRSTSSRSQSVLNHFQQQIPHSKALHLLFMLTSSPIPSRHTHAVRCCQRDSKKTMLFSRERRTVRAWEDIREGAFGWKDSTLFLSLTLSLFHVHRRN